MTPRKSRSPGWASLLVGAVFCVAVGGIAAWLLGGETHRSAGPGSFAAPGASTPPGALSPSAGDEAAEVKGMTRESLENEVRRLSTLVRQKDEQITELTIQLKLAREGSHSSTASNAQPTQ